MKGQDRLRVVRISGVAKMEVGTAGAGKRREGRTTPIAPSWDHPSFSLIRNPCELQVFTLFFSPNLAVSPLSNLLNISGRIVNT